MDSRDGGPSPGLPSAETLIDTKAIGFDGAMTDRGMPSFEGRMTEADLTRFAAIAQGAADAVRPK